MVAMRTLGLDCIREDHFVLLDNERNGTRFRGRHSLGFGGTSNAVSEPELMCKQRNLILRSMVPVPVLKSLRKRDVCAFEQSTCIKYSNSSVTHRLRLPLRRSLYLFPLFLLHSLLLLPHRLHCQLIRSPDRNVLRPVVRVHVF